MRPCRRRVKEPAALTLRCAPLLTAGWLLVDDTRCFSVLSVNDVNTVTPDGRCRCRGGRDRKNMSD